MDSRKSEAFIRIASNGSITKTAEEMGYTQSGITQMLNSLESELGVKLLNRTNKGAKLTSDGEHMLPFFHEEKIWEERIMQECQALQGVVTGKIKIGTLSSIGDALLPSIVGVFHERYPGVLIRISVMGNAQLRTSLLNRETDIIFIDDVIKLKKGEFATRHLFDDEVVAVVAKDNPLAKKKSVTFEELAEYPFLEATMDNQFSTISYAGEKRDELDWDVAFSLDDDLMLMNMVQSGLGVTLAGKMLVMNFPDKVVSIPLAQKTYRSFYVGVMSEKHVSPAVRAFVDVTEEVIAEKTGKQE
ncbi:MAG: LysR family transcriptional regulator [Anaerovoracaceae bacterium]|nr:LysR family transcriptional regulator [Anaerovoracaceae bacterium]